MALGNNSTVENKEYVNLKFTKDRQDNPKFVVEEDFKETDTSYTEVKGTLKSLKASFTPKGGKNKYDTYGVKILLEDETNLISISTTITNGSKDMLNWLCSASIWEEVTLATWINKGWYVASAAMKDPKASNKEDKFYKSFFEWSDDYKANFKTLIWNEINSRAVDEAPKAKEEIDLDSIPF